MATGAALHLPGLSVFPPHPGNAGTPIYLRRHRATRVSNRTTEPPSFIRLLPFAAKPFFWSPALGLIDRQFIGIAAFVIVFYRLASLDIPNAETASRIDAGISCFVRLFAPYTESLWLLFAALSFWYVAEGTSVACRLRWGIG